MNHIEIITQKLLQKQNIFLTGGAGVGKTTITNEVIQSFFDEGKKVAKLASTAMAATLLGGQTLHSFFDLSIAANLEELESRGKFNIAKKIKKLIASMDLIVIDEISMVSAELMEMVATRLLQADFTGTLLVVGDFLQLPPVVRGYQEVFFAFEALAWEEFGFQTIELSHIYRTDDRDFIELLHQVRFGHVDENVHNMLNEFIKPLPEDLSEFTFLFGKNDSAALHNKMQLAHLDGALFSKTAQIVKHDTKAQRTDIERFMNDARIEEVLELKIGAPVLFTRNSWNYYNGERGVIVNVDTSNIYVQKSDGKVIKLETTPQSKNIWIEKTVDGKKEIVEEALFSIYQFPIKLGFGITIHKSQGMSIEDLIVETKEIFAPSQFYVALSRSSNPKRLTLIAPQKQWYNLAFVNEKALEFVKSIQIK
ncbi:MAG: DEAD/DEAH box helicase [Sulfurimonadaceae bacterium]|jgi:ATP-dependent exoDNAse (exonuclease V) alpha subunit|nr:DEAD/DEAH box helicase [Sulfurimonadaceae bacterium]